MPTEVEQADLLPPPNDLDAEGLVISHCFHSGPLAGLEPKHFYSDANRWTYQAICDLHSRTEPTDPIAVARELTVMQRLEQAGGRQYLALLCDTQPVSAHPEKHAEAIREFYRRRLLSDACLVLRARLRTGQIMAAQAWSEFKRTCEESNEE